MLRIIRPAPISSTNETVTWATLRPVWRGSISLAIKCFFLFIVIWIFTGGLDPATLTASANALPGEALYPVKQAKEEVAVRMAADDQARALALVQRANARLVTTADGKTLAAASSGAPTTRQQ